MGTFGVTVATVGDVKKERTRPGRRSMQHPRRGTAGTRITVALRPGIKEDRLMSNEDQVSRDYACNAGTPAFLPIELDTYYPS